MNASSRTLEARGGSRRARCLGSASGALLALSIGCSAVPGTAPETTPVAAGAVVADNEHRYALSLPNDQWARSTHAALAKDADSEVELVRRQGNAWILTYRFSRSILRLADVVSNRRSQMLAEGASSYHETCSFLPTGDLIPASMARYVNGSQVLLVLTAVRDSTAVEVISATNRGSGLEPEILQILQSLHFLDAGKLDP